MSRISDQRYLREDQYKNASNLNARIRLHAEFSTNPYGWFRWVFDQFEGLAKARLLELGCGPGDLWLENMDRIPDGWDVLLSDFSSGMLDQARENLADKRHSFKLETIDAQSIPYQSDRFDIVIANHFLYHVPNRARAISEIRRVLKSGGWFYATTIGKNHMKTLKDLAARFDPENSDFLGGEEIPFNLENGADQLQVYFSNVVKHRYPDGLRVTEAGVLVDYALSGMRLKIDRNRREDFAAFVRKEMAANDGAITITKDSGIFVAR